MDLSILLGLAMLAGGYLPTAFSATVAGAAATLLIVRRRAGVGACLLAIALMALAGARARSQVASYAREREAVRGALGPPSRCAASALVVTSPVAMRQVGDRAAGALDRGEAFVLAWDGDLTDVDCEGRALARPVRARIYGGPAGLARGDTVELIGDLAASQLFRNADLPDPLPPATRRAVTASGGAHDVRIVAHGRGLAAWIDRFRARVRERIVATFVPDAEPMARALVLGETDLDEADAEAFRTSGLAHLLAVSGTHLVLVVAGAVAALTSLLRCIPAVTARYEVGRVAAALGIVLAWFYADFAGGSGSANRAAAMMSCVLGARACGRRTDGPRAFGLSLCGATACDPLVGFDLSFVLSVASTAGLMLLQPAIADALRGWVGRGGASVPPQGVTARALDGAIAACATTMAATLGCAPVVALLSPTLPLGGIPANLLAVPLGELAALPLCLAHVALEAVPTIERGAAIVASGSLIAVRAIARATSETSWLALPIPRPTSWQVAAMCVALAGCWVASARRRVPTVLVCGALLIATELATARAGRPRGKLRVTVLDIGQGDAVLVELPDGSAMLVDGGGMVGSPVDTGRAVIAPLLRIRRRTELAAVVLSHPHPDHFGGLAGATARVGVGAFWDTGQGESEGAGPSYAALLAALRARGVPVLRPDGLCGRHALGGAVVDVLAPCPTIVPFANANDNSFVIRISYGAHAALLVGDAERAEEENLLRERPRELRADFLKVGHHGSRTSSSPAFLDAVQPRYAAISCGVRNRFGHPHGAALAALAQARAQNGGDRPDVTRTMRTDQVGSISWESDGRAMRLTTATDARW